MRMATFWRGYSSKYIVAVVDDDGFVFAVAVMLLNTMIETIEIGMHNMKM